MGRATGQPSPHTIFAKPLRPQTSQRTRTVSEPAQSLSRWAEIFLAPEEWAEERAAMKVELQLGSLGAINRPGNRALAAKAKVRRQSEWTRVFIQDTTAVLSLKSDY
jgi:hypothetical protein